MRFVPTKTPEQQSCLMLHRTRHLFIRQQTALINSIRAHLAEFGIVAPVGRKGVTELLHIVADPSDKRVSEVARACLAALGSQLLGLKKQILEFDRMILAWHRSNQTSKRLHYIPGVGPMLATALVASIADPSTSDQHVTSRPGSGWFRSSTQAEAKTGLAVSANRVIAICGACSWPEHSRSSATPRSMAPGIGLGSQRCWRESRPRLPLSRLPTRLREWPGP
jgi:transposase